MKRILLVVTVLIVYASLYPWQFHARQLPASPLWILLHSWPAAADRFLARDVAVNLLGYIPLGMFAFLAFAQTCPKAFSMAASLVLALVLSSSIEMVQLFDASRSCSALDVVCDVTGAAIGVVLARTVVRPACRAVFNPSGPVLLLLCWVGYQTLPLLPLLSRTRLEEKVAELWHGPSLSAAETIAGLVNWLAAARLLETVAGAGRVRTPLLVLMLLLPGRLLIAGRTVTWSELIGAAAAYAIWSRLLSGCSKRTPLLAWLSAGALALRGLAPFHFSATPGAFSWVPFGATLASEPDSGLVVLLRKSFLYGAAVWLFREAGCRYLTCALGVALLLGTIEAAQMYLPGRAAEITDPLLVLMVALLLRLLEAKQRRREF